MAGNFDPYYKWLGIPPKDLGLNRLMVAPAAVLQSIGAKA